MPSRSRPQMVLLAGRAGGGLGVAAPAQRCRPAEGAGRKGTLGVGVPHRSRRGDLLPSGTGFGGRPADWIAAVAGLHSGDIRARGPDGGDLGRAASPSDQADPARGYEAGQLLGHIKVGWNDVTRSLVRHEAAILLALTGPACRRRRRRGGRGLPPEGGPLTPARPAGAAPRGAGTGASPCRFGRRGQPAGTAAAAPACPRRRHAQAGRALGVDRAALGASDFWSDLLGRAKHLVNHAAVDASISADLAAVIDAVESGDATTELDFGLMHGDWAPWNMASLGTSLAVWDWERSPDPWPGWFRQCVLPFPGRSLDPGPASGAGARAESACAGRDHGRFGRSTRGRSPHAPARAA